ncbi:MAG: hypothetical protein V8S39_00570 [Lachnospiraceae bacterium]
MKKLLLIMEVSQKQAYIFKNKELKRNIDASYTIDEITSSGYFEKYFPEYYNKEKNLVYSGGGHTILVFDNDVEENDNTGKENQAVRFAKKLSKQIFCDYDGLEVFIKIMDYNENDDPSKNIQNLMKKLEEKKAIRRASFRQGTFGMEVSKGEAERVFDSEKKEKEAEQRKKDAENRREKRIREEKKKIQEEETTHYELVTQLEKLGGNKDDNNFIAVVHIDGNLMGKKVQENDKELRKILDRISDPEKKLDMYREKKQEFSEKIDKLFKGAYSDMQDAVKKQIENGNLKDLSLEEVVNEEKQINFPVRRIITAGDDICFVSEGRIGIECAVEYMKALWKRSKGENSACAGVAIVHQSYPFYKAYEIAESLCSSAKKYNASLDKEGCANACAIDWHIEYGEMYGGLDEIRKHYVDADGKSILARPYFVCGKAEYEGKAGNRTYADFKQTMEEMEYALHNKCEDEEDRMIARRKLKELRTYLKESDEAVDAYFKKSRLDQYLTKNDKNFDVIEVMDTYIGFQTEEDK